MRVNPDRPRVRQRFGIAHEIGHTFFPGFGDRVHCRGPAGTGWAEDDDTIEGLCDVAAVELLLPMPWFGNASGGVAEAAGLVRLAGEWDASIAATLRRYVEVDSRPMAALFLGWRLKPTQARLHAGDRPKVSLFGEDAESSARAARRLRVDHAVLNDPFRACYANHLPRDKSMDPASVVQRAARTGERLDETEWVDLGTVAGEFEVHAVPLWTPAKERGPDGELAVAAILRPRWEARSPAGERQMGLF